MKLEAGADGTQTKILAGGGVEADALRVTVASDSTGVLSVDDNGSSLTVDGTVAVTGVSTAANQTTLIGHVDGIEALLTTIDGDTSNLSVVGGGTEAAAQRVTIASDSTGVLSVDDNGGSLTVDGSVTANAGTNLNTSLLALEAGGNLAAAATSLGTIDNAISGNEMQVDVVAALPAGNNNIGDVDVASSALPTGASTAANQTTVIGHLDGVEGLLTTIDADTSNLSVVGSGTEATAQRVTIATDSTGVLSVDDNGSTLSVDDGAGSLTVDNATISVVGSGTEATAQRVTIATDSTGVLSVDDNGASLTVDGTVAATQSGSWVLAANSGVDVGDVTINNASGGSAVNVQDGGNSLTVDYATTGSGTATGALRVELPTNGTGVLATVGAVTAITNALPAGTNGIGKLTANSGVDIGDVDVTSISAGTNTIGDVGIKPRTTGGYTIFRSIDLDETEEEIKGTAGQVFGWYIFNAAATTHYVKFYNATAANVTVGSTTPVLTLPIPAGGAANVFSETGIAFGTAITAAATTGVADADTGAPAANAVVINVFYA